MSKYTPLRKISCCPTFLAAIAGPWLAVSGAVFVDRLISEVLLDYTLIGPQFASSSETRLDAGIRRIAQLVNALEQCTSDLESYYRNLPLTHSENQLFNSQVSMRRSSVPVQISIACRFSAIFALHTFTSSRRRTKRVSP